MVAKVKLTYDRFARRWGYVLEGVTYPLRGTWMGTDSEQVRQSLAELNVRRAALGLEELELQGVAP